jgi:lambda repressor-like predicted transcriptional regulator
MKAELVKYEVGLILAKKGIRTFSQAAEKIGVTLPHLSNVLACRENNPRVQLLIAKLCGMKPSQVFGEFTHPTLKESA